MTNEDNIQYWYFEGNLKKLFFNSEEGQYGAVFASNTKSPCDEQVGAYGCVPGKLPVELLDQLSFKKLRKEEVFVLRDDAKDNAMDNGNAKVNGNVKVNGNGNGNGNEKNEKAYRLYDFISHHENNMFEVIFQDKKDPEGNANPADGNKPKHNYTIAMVCVKI